MLRAVLIAGAGGFVGTCLRFLSEKLGALIWPGIFPLGTFMANVIGCLLIGIFYGWASNRKWFNEKYNLLLITGLCGGFTTFSSFSDEMFGMFSNGEIAAFVIYLLSSIIIGLAAVALGVVLVKKTTSKAKMS